MSSNIEKIKELLGQTDSMEKLLVPQGGDFMADIKRISGKPEFEKWKANLKRELTKLHQDQLVEEAMQLLTDGFKKGWDDEKEFLQLRANLDVIAENLEEYTETVEPEVQDEMKLKGGSVVKTAYDEYTLIKQIGSGGNGRVFSATAADGVQVAIKFVVKNTSTEKRKRFKNEINFCERHQHKNIVQILDRGYAYLDNTDYLFYAMPLYAETLRERIKRGIPHEQVTGIFVGILEGLRFAHAQGAIHRDIKPENIMFAKNHNEPILCDFGIAHFAEDDLITAVETQLSDRLANFQYAAPEQRVRGVAATPQTDIYSAALILNEMFTGEIPQATGYKRIKDIDTDYEFLDDLFDLLYRQSAEDRLFPEDEILSRMKLFAENHQRAKEIALLQGFTEEATTPEEFEAIITGKEYRDGMFVFTFNRAIPAAWYQFIAYGTYTCSQTAGYEHKRLLKIGKNELAMPLRGDEREHDLESILRNLEAWVAAANEKYNQIQQQEIFEERKRKEIERKNAIARAKKESELASMIAQL